MRLMICLTNVLCSNEDVENQPVPVAENQPVPVAEAATLVANNEDGSSKKLSWKVKQFCYSPIYYYIKVCITVYGTVSAVVLWNTYSTKCAEWADKMVVKAWFLGMVVLWAIQGVTHLVFIVTRFITKQPPSNILYSGKFEAMLKLPLMIEMVILIVVAVVGYILVKATDNESEECIGELRELKTHSISYITLGLLMVIRFGKASVAS
jgi:hypothetical protein